ncbi:hypothetical protein [Bradyrhizobium sp.]|uniref:hypothetical protein n=1 Tax=Bradyrhizobium sp. TaxID=376 RepID=UPI0025C63562|nr:hypothetical protein [Bradyrhizobium sp.]
MGLLFVGVLAGILIGYGWFAPSQANFQPCTSPGCSDTIAAGQPIAPRTTTLSFKPAPSKAKSAAAAKSRKRISSKPARRADRVAGNERPPTRISVSPSDRPLETPNAVLEKARISVAAKMEDPASAEFGDMKRAIRRNTLGRPVDTICGRVRGRNASGEDTGERPFLYLVKEDDAYVVDGKPESAAAIAYRNICN